MTVCAALSFFLGFAKEALESSSHDLFLSVLFSVQSSLTPGLDLKTVRKEDDLPKKRSLINAEIPIKEAPEQLLFSTINKNQEPMPRSCAGRPTS